MKIKSARFVDFDYNPKNFKWTNTMVEKNDYTDKIVYYAVDNDGTCGILVYDEQEKKICSFEIREDCQGMGYGSRMIKYLQKRTDCLYVYPKKTARVFYEKQGFLPIEGDEFYWLWSKYRFS